MLPASISVPVRASFDFDSVLLYPSNAFSHNGQFTITRLDGSAYRANRERLSYLDVQRINSLYGGRG
jgi:hypothetical protein